MLLICNSVCKAIFLAASRGKGDTGAAAETWAQVAPATRATTSTRRRKTWKEENIERGKRENRKTLLHVISLEKHWPWRGNTRKGGWKRGTSSPALHFLICDAEMNKTNFSVEGCEETLDKSLEHIGG